MKKRFDKRFEKEPVEAKGNTKKNPELVEARDTLAREVGPDSDPTFDALETMRIFKLPRSFKGDVLKDAERAARTLDQVDANRLDLRRKFIFTCDPKTAKDFDDALSLEIDKEGRRVLGVHIADVSHFVRPGSPLDREAYRRSTSVYLVGKVVPMLPEQLSDGVCSLMPNVDRLAFSVFITFDAKGRPVARSFAKSVIRSKRRFAYEEVMALLVGKAKAGSVTTVNGDPVKVPRLPKDQLKVVLELHKLAQQLRSNRFAAGALNMEVPELEVVLDDNDEMTGLAVRPYDESHQLVEECMIAANVAVATEMKLKGIRILARLHEEPDPEKLEDLKADLAKVGMKTGDLTKRGQLAKLLQTFKGPLAPMMTTMVLRSLKRACYSGRKIGHFGLAAPYYAHFTSPIRRYPDLMLHRQLESYILGNGGKAPQKYLDKAAIHTSEAEQRADEAERALVELKKYRFLEKQLRTGELVDYVGIITRCTSYGAFVDIPQCGCFGLIHISHLSNEYVRFDALREELTAPHGAWKVGDKLMVRVSQVDFAARHADFVPSSYTGNTPSSKRRANDRKIFGGRGRR